MPSVRYHGHRHFTILEGYGGRISCTLYFECYFGDFTTQVDGQSLNTFGGVSASSPNDDPVSIPNVLLD